MNITAAIRYTFDRHPLLRLVAVRVFLRSYVVNRPIHEMGLCYWLRSRGVPAYAFIEEYRTACGEGPDRFKWVCFYSGPTPERVAFAERLLKDLTEYLDNGWRYD